MSKKTFRLTERATYIVGIIVVVLLVVGSSVIFVAMGEGQEAHPPDTTHRSIPTATPTLTPSPTPFIGTPTPLFTEYFIDNRKGWTLGNQGGYTRTFADSQLTLTSTNHKTLVESLPTNKVFDDFVLTTSFTFVSGDQHDCVGLYLRGDSNLDHDYRVAIYGNNTYSIDKESLGDNNIPEISYLAGPEPNAAISKQGTVNIVNVTMKDSTLTLVINNKTVKTITDPDYKKGQIALFVQHGDTSEGVTASFYTLLINPLPPPPVTSTPEA